MRGWPPEEAGRLDGGLLPRKEYEASMPDSTRVIRL